MIPVDAGASLVLMAHDGRVVQWQDAVRCVDIALMPASPTLCAADGDWLFLDGHESGEAAWPATALATGLHRRWSEAAPVGHFALFCMGRPLEIAPDGSLVLGGAAPAFFSLVRLDTVKLVSHLVSNRWIEDGREEPTRAGEITVTAGPSVSIRSALILFSEIENSIGSAPADLRPKELRLRFSGWRIRSLRLFKPLIYMVAFGHQGLFDCAELAIRSLYRFGDYAGDVIMLTSDDHLDFSDGLPEEIRPRVRTVSRPAADVIDYMVTRFQFTGVPGAADYQPIIYVDTDVLIDAPLDPFLTAVTRSNAIHLTSVGPGTLMEESNYYGVRLFKQDPGFDDAEAEGFNSGIIAFRNVDSVADTFDRISAAIYDYASNAPDRMFFPAADQCMANYVLHREGRVDGNLMTPLVKLANHTIPLDETWRRGFVHFIGGVGNAAPKITQMLRYLEMMEPHGAVGREAPT